jgi:serine/threonine protein kinase
VARFQRGTTFLGRYVLLGPIGHGGVSVVYEALDTQVDRHVAIKMLDPTLASDTRAQERIRREAIITDRMRHPSVPRIYEYGDAPLHDGTSVAYVVMELLDGVVLAGYLAEGPLPWLDAVQVGAKIADVLAVAHKRGVVHRDLTAVNIMITEDGARIIDFGLAVTVRTPDQGKGPFILPRAPLTNDFAGPGEPADDVYALGVLLYQMVTGRPPFANLPPPTATAMMRRVVHTPVLTVPGVPRGLAEICRRCMAKRPGDRPDAATVALDLWALIVPRAPRELPAPEHAPRAIGTTVDTPSSPDDLGDPGDPAANRTPTGTHPGVGGLSGNEARARRLRPRWNGRTSSGGHRVVDRARPPAR